MQNGIRIQPRQKQDYLEAAAGLARLMERHGLSQGQAAAKLGISQSAVANKLRILRQPPQVLEALRRSGLTERHARALLRLPEAQRPEAVAYLEARNCTVAQTEAYIEQVLQQGKPGDPFRDVRTFLRSLDRSLENVRSAGIACACGREETEREIVLTIRLPKQKGA